MGYLLLVFQDPIQGRPCIEGLHLFNFLSTGTFPPSCFIFYDVHVFEECRPVFLHTVRQRDLSGVSSQ